MEKYARQAKVEGVKLTEDLVVTTESELYRVLNLHYNRNNQIEVGENRIFSLVRYRCILQYKRNGTKKTRNIDMYLK